MWPYFAPKPLRGGASKGADADFGCWILNFSRVRGTRLRVDYGTDCSRTACAGGADAREGRKAPTRVGVETHPAFAGHAYAWTRNAKEFQMWE